MSASPSSTLLPPDNNTRSSSYLSLKRFKDKASSLFSSSPSPQPLLSLPPSTLHGRRASSSASSTVKHFVISTTNAITRKGRHARALSESATSRPSLSIQSSAKSPSFHSLFRSISAGSAESHEIAPPQVNTTFRHEDYPRAPIVEHDRQSPSTPRSPFYEAFSTIQGEIDITVPALLQQGTPMLKISAKEKKNRIFRLDADLGQVLWQSKKSGIIVIENIKEIRSGPEARYYREQFNIALAFEERWLTLIYIADGKYKTLHMVAFTSDVFHMWDTTLRRLHSLRQDLMSGLGNMERRQMVWEKQYWKDADQSGDHKLTFEEIEQMCRRLNINSPRSDLLNRFMEADVRSRGYLNFTDFRRFVTLLKARPDISAIFAAAKGSKSVFTFEVFENFMRNSQRSDLGRPELIKLFMRYGSRDASVQTQSTQTTDNSIKPIEESPEPCPLQTTPLTSPPISQATLNRLPSTPPPTSTIPVPPGDCAHPCSSWSIAAFTSFLLSADNSPFHDHAAKAWHDMSRPLSEYFISSSHNTYLVGHQLIGDSTIEGYIRALLHGCRSVELDIWDGDDGPAIFHGHTLTSKIPLADVARAIAKYAFVASPYPVIISAEIHCNVEQQHMVAEVMKREFGEALVTSPIDDEETFEELPSPERLKYRILLKAKNLYVVPNAGEALPQSLDPVDSPFAEISSTETSNSDIETIKESKPAEVSRARSLVSRVRKRVASLPSSDSNSPPPVASHTQMGLSPPGEHGVARRNSSASERPKPKMSVPLAELLVYTVGVKCRGLNKKEQYAVEHVFSLSEKQANRMLKESMTDLIKHNRTHVVRVYPKGTRLNSSNYEPHRYWASGAQLVAINWQTFDLGYMMNYAMFQRNGRSGYVLKPLALRSKGKDSLTKRTKHLLDVTIISAQQLPRPKDQNGREISTKHTVDPFVEVSVHVPDWLHTPFQPEQQSSSYSVPKNESGGNNTGSTRTISRATSVVKNNGFNPIWEQTVSIPFDCVGDMKDLIFVRFQVKDEYDGTDLAVYCISLGSLMPGFRHLPLHDKQLSQYLFSTLFVHTGVRDVLE